MSRRMKTGALKIVAASIALGMFAFIAFIVPEHLAESESHDHCAICQFIQHTPLLTPEDVADVDPLSQPEVFLLIFGDTVSPDPQLRSPLSRAPPLLLF